MSAITVQTSSPKTVASPMKMTDLMATAKGKIAQLEALQQQNNLPTVLSSPKKYQVYATTLIEAVSRIPQCEEALIYNTAPLASDYAALVTQMHRHLTTDLALRAPNLAIFARQQGEETLNRLLFVLIKQFTESVNIKHAPNLKQTYEMASLVQVEFSDLSLSDVALCLRQTKSGQYGPLYESFDFVRLGEFLRKYRAEKTAYQAQKHTELKYSPSTALQDLVAGLEYAPDHIRQSIKELAEGNFAKAVSQAAPAQPTNDSQRPPIGVDLDQVLAHNSPSKPRLSRSKPPTEQQYRQQIKAQLTPYLDQMTDQNYAYYINYYQTFRQDALADWLRAEQQKRQSPDLSSAA